MLQFTHYSITSKGQIIFPGNIKLTKTFPVSPNSEKLINSYMDNTDGISCYYGYEVQGDNDTILNFINNLSTLIVKISPIAVSESGVWKIYSRELTIPSFITIMKKELLSDRDILYYLGGNVNEIFNWLDTVKDRVTDATMISDSRPFQRESPRGRVY